MILVKAINLLLCIHLLITLSESEASRILGIFIVGAKSTFMSHQQTMKALINRGHEVYVISVFPQKERIYNYTDLDVFEGVSDFTEKIGISSVVGFLNTLHLAYGAQLRNCKTVYENEKIRNLINLKMSFDLVIAEIDGPECILPLAFAFNAPVIGTTTDLLLFPETAFNLGIPVNPSYMPEIFSSHSLRMNFLERLTNTVYYILHWWYRRDYTYKGNLEAQKLFPDSPSIDTLFNRISLVFTNSADYIIPKPTVPNTVDISGIHLRDPESLPKDISNFIEESKLDIIYVSLGSIVGFSSFPKEIHEIFVRVLSNLPYCILWKHDKPEIIGNIPKNILVRKWFSQTSILAQKKVKLFISHCGIYSIKETIYYAKPLLCLPVFYDQPMNAAMIKELNIGLYINPLQVNEKILLHHIKAVLEDKKYTQNIEKYSKIYKDRPMKPNETVIYWTEYVIRHGRSLHLKTAAVNLPIYQYLLLDVILFVSVILFFILYLFKKVLCIFFNSLKNALCKEKLD